MSTYEKIVELLAEQLNVEKGIIKPESDVVKDLGADSLDIVELIMDLEKEFEVTIPESEAENIATVGDAIKFIENAGK